MPEFTASDPGSSFPNQNILFNSASGITGQEIQKNQLALQGQQIDLSNANMAQVGQAAAGLLSAYPDEASRAAAYPRVVGMLQAQGFAKNAPPTYPGEGVLRSLVNQSIPAKDLYSSGALMTPAQQQLLGSGNTGTTTSTTGTGTTGSGDFGARLAQSESGGKTSVINQQGYTGTYQFGKQRLADLGYYTPAPGEDMKNNTTWAGKVSVPGFNVTDQQSFAANPAAQQAVFNTHLGNIDQAIAATPGASRFDPNGLRAVAHLGGIEGMQKFVASGGAFSPSDANGTSLVAYYNKFSGGAPGGATTASAAPATAQPGQPVPTQVAGPPMVSTAPAAPTAAPGGPPAAQQSAQFKYSDGRVGSAPDAGGGVHFADGNYGTPAPGPSVPVSPAATVAPAQPGQPAPAAQPAPTAAPASTARLPEVSTIPTGQNSAPYKQAMQLQQEAMKYDAVGGTNPAFAKHAADLRLQAAGILQAGATVSAQQNGREGELEVVTGKFTPYQALPSPRFTGGAAVYNKTTGGWDQPTPASQADAVQGHWGVSGSGAPQFFPEASVPPHANYDIALEDLKKDRGEIASIGDAGRAAQNDNLRVQEMRDILTNANTGPGTETAARLRAWVARWTPGELSKWDGSGANLSNPAAIEMFQKLGFVGAVTQERGSTPRGGYQATKLFQQFNPGAQLLTSTNQGLLAQRLIANQAEEDYAQGAQDHYNTQRQRLKSPERDYDPISSFDAKWQAQRNPQVYAAAIGALGGQDPEMWSRGLNKDEIQRVKDVVTRADPNAVIHMPGEGKVVLQPNAKPLPPGFKVQ